MILLYSIFLAAMVLILGTVLGNGLVKFIKYIFKESSH